MTLRVASRYEAHMLRSLRRRLRRLLARQPYSKSTSDRAPELIAPPAPAASAMPGPIFDFTGDGMALIGKNTSFIDDPRFSAAWRKAVEGNVEGWRGNVPDIRWRAHVACWAASHALTLDGDFVECGVHTGLLSLTVCNYLDFNRTGRKVPGFSILSRAFQPIDLKGQEIEHAAWMNDTSISTSMSMRSGTLHHSRAQD